MLSGYQRIFTRIGKVIQNVFLLPLLTKMSKCAIIVLEQSCALSQFISRGVIWHFVRTAEQS